MSFPKIRTISISAAVLGAVLLLTAASGDLESEVAGKVSRLQGSAIAIQDATPRVLKLGAEVLVGDVISTGAKSRLQLTMIDDGVLTLGARTNFVVMEYVMGANGKGSAALRLLDGAIASISGKIAQADPKQFRLDTQTATIGVRGTTFWGGRLDADSPQEFTLLDGKGITITNRAGTVAITRVNDGTAVTSQDTAPTAPRAWPADKQARAKATVAFQ